MAELDRNNISEENGPEGQEDRPAYTPASFEKRAAAWMGLGYVLFVLFLITFAIFTGGKGAPGTFPLLLIPAAIALLAFMLPVMGRGSAAGGRGLLVCAARRGSGPAGGGRGRDRPGAAAWDLRRPQRKRRQSSCPSGAGDPGPVQRGQ